MAIKTAYTLQEAREILRILKECEMALITGQAKAYRIGTREYTALDLKDIHSMIGDFSNIVEALSGEGRTTQVVRIVPRDL